MIGSRYMAMGLLFVAVALTPLLVKRAHTPATAMQSPPPPGVPQEALEALEQGRYWRASRILRDYLAMVPDTTPSTLLLAAEAEAGWGGWDRVESLLGGRPWLSEVEGGRGWLLLGRSRLELGRWADSGRALDHYLRVADGTGDRERGLAELRRASALAQAGELAGALAGFDRAAELLPQLADWVHVFAADAASFAADTAEMSRRLTRTDPTLAREWGWRVRVRGLLNATDLPGALRAAESAANALGQTSARAEAWAQVGALRLMQADTAGARSAFRRAIEAAPGASGAVDAARQLDAIPDLTPDERLRVGRLYVRHGNFDRGIRGLQAYLSSDAGSSLERAEVGLELGRAFFRAGRYADAERRMLELAGVATSPRIGAEAMFLAGRAQYRQGRGEVAKATFLRTAERYPNESASAEALYLLADLEHDDMRLERAERFYRRVIAIRPGIEQAGLAAMRLGGMRFAAGDFADAARVFEEYRRAHPRGRRYQQATYWAGLAHLRLGREEEARARFRELRRSDPISWYGIRAADRLGADFWDMPVAPSPPESPRIREEVEAALVRIDLLRDIGREELAEFELQRLRRHFASRDAALYGLAEALNRRGLTFTGIRLGWEIHRREGVWNPRLLRIIYPFPYRRMILAEAAEQGLDPFLVAGLIRQESMFHSSIASPAGAIGLMQIMPATGRALASGAGITPFELDLLENPEINLHLGSTYLAEMLRSFGPDRVVSALAAYNAGPHRVERWRQFPEYGDVELFAERIPFAETRDYVKIVQQNARIYASLYRDEVERGE